MTSSIGASGGLGEQQVSDWLYVCIGHYSCLPIFMSCPSIDRSIIKWESHEVFAWFESSTRWTSGRSELKSALNDLYDDDDDDDDDDGDKDIYDDDAFHVRD